MRFMLLTLSISLLTGCVTLTPTKETNGAVCDVWKDVSWSSKDTTGTIIEVRQNNARREGWCAK